MPVPRDEHERTLAFADIALGQIKALSQAATPRNFEIWYQYGTGHSPGLNRAINDTLAEKGTLQEADIERIYKAYLSPNSATDRIDNVGSRMTAEITQVLATIDGRKIHEQSGATFVVTDGKSILDVRFRIPSDVFETAKTGAPPSATLSVSVRDGSDTDAIVRPTIRAMTVSTPSNLPTGMLN